MTIYFRHKKLKKICENFKIAQKTLGKKNIRKLLQRIQELIAVETLDELSYLPPMRCHILKGKRKYQFAVDLVHPLRLIFKPYGPIENYLEERKINKKLIKEIIIMEVTNYHD